MGSTPASHDGVSTSELLIRGDSWDGPSAWGLHQKMGIDSDRAASFLYGRDHSFSQVHTTGSDLLESSVGGILSLSPTASTSQLPGIQRIPPCQARAPSLTEAGDGIFLCKHVTLEYASSSQLPREVRLALKHPHGYVVKGKSPQLQGQDNPLNENIFSTADAERNDISTMFPVDGLSKHNECGMCLALEEASAILKPYGLQLSWPPSKSLNSSDKAGIKRDNATCRRYNHLNADQRIEAESNKCGSAACTQLALREGVHGLATQGDAGMAVPQASIDTSCPANVCQWHQTSEPLSSTAGHLVDLGLNLSDRAIVDAVNAVKKALTYFLLQAAPPSASGVVRTTGGSGSVHVTRKQHSSHVPGLVAAMKHVNNTGRRQHEAAAGRGNPQTTAERPQLSQAVAEHVLCGRSTQNCHFDSQETLVSGLLDALSQLHDHSSVSNQAAICSSHFSGMFSHTRVVLTNTSQHFR